MTNLDKSEEKLIQLHFVKFPYPDGERHFVAQTSCATQRERILWIGEVIKRHQEFTSQSKGTWEVVFEGASSFFYLAGDAK